MLTHISLISTHINFFNDFLNVMLVLHYIARSMIIIIIFVFLVADSFAVKRHHSLGGLHDMKVNSPDTPNTPSSIKSLFV